MRVGERTGDEEWEGRMDEREGEREGLQRGYLCGKKITLTPRGQRCHGNTAPAFKG